MVEELQGFFTQAGGTGEIELYAGVHHGFAFPQRWCDDKPAAERHWERRLALYRRRLAAVAAHRRDPTTLGQRPQRGSEEHAACGVQHHVDASTLFPTPSRFTAIENFRNRKLVMPETLALVGLGNHRVEGDPQHRRLGLVPPLVVHIGGH
jgi:hypothetical protein